VGVGRDEGRDLFFDCVHIIKTFFFLPVRSLLFPLFPSTRPPPSLSLPLYHVVSLLHDLNQLSTRPLNLVISRRSECLYSMSLKFSEFRRR